MFFLKGLLDFLTIYFRRPKFFAMIVIILMSVCVTIAVYSSHVVQHIPIYVTDLDNSTISRTVRGFLHAVPDISVEGVVDNAEEAKQALIDGKVAGIVWIPNGLAQAVKTQQPTSIKVYIDGSNIVEARSIDRAVQTVVKSTSIGVSMIALSKQGVRETQLLPLLQAINLDVDRPFNPNTIYTDYLLPVLIFFNLWLFICLMVSAAFQEEPSQEIMSHKVRRRFYYVGRMAAIGIVALAIGIVIFLKGLPHIDIVLSSSPIMALTSLVVFILLSEALFTAVNLVLIKVRVLAMTVCCLFCMMTLMISGLTWPLEMIPWYIREFSLWMPLTPFLQSVQVFLYTDATWEDLAFFATLFLKQASLYVLIIFVVMRIKDIVMFIRYMWHRMSGKPATPSLAEAYHLPMPGSSAPAAGSSSDTTGTAGDKSQAPVAKATQSAGNDKNVESHANASHSEILEDDSEAVRQLVADVAPAPSAPAPREAEVSPQSSAPAPREAEVSPQSSTPAPQSSAPSSTETRGNVAPAQKDENVDKKDAAPSVQNSEKTPETKEAKS